MASLGDYLREKRAALLRRRERVDAEHNVTALRATVRAESGSGVRRIRVRDFQLISDSVPAQAGYDLGPTSPELALGALGSCLTHIFLVQAALREVPLEAVEVEVRGQTDARAGRPGWEHVPIYPHDLSYTVRITSPAAPEVIDALHAEVERVCPVLNLMRHPQEISGQVLLGATSRPGPGDG
jgi:uncharacterized OsmC-like protein